uniref:PRC-barrel domain-containing protein n=1 Tax=Fagus sylvatica TaxID=28930 RepID=A0A2N9FT64_FAGSY
MCDCLPSIPPPFTLTKSRCNFFLTKSKSNWRPLKKPILFIHTRNSTRVRNARGPPNPSGAYGELAFKGESDETPSSGLDFVELEGGLRSDGKRDERSEESLEEKDLVEVGESKERVGLKKGRQLLRRSNLLAKQVISIRSALSLGFVSQLWVDTTCWLVLFLEVRQNLLSGESERFLLEDVSQVGDVVLVQDESVMENEFKMVGLETLVGYKVVTPARRNIGKVRGYSFNINSGAIESLELDSFGISIIPSSLVSTYALFVEDVLEVKPDAVVVHEAAASRIQRLTKGFLGTQNVGTSVDEVEEYPDFERPARSEYGQSIRRSYGSQRFQPKNRETEDDWELPMDYL